MKRAGVAPRKSLNSWPIRLFVHAAWYIVYINISSLPLCDNLQCNANAIIKERERAGACGPAMVFR